MWNFYSLYIVLHEFVTVLMTFSADFRENSWDVGVHIVLWVSLLMLVLLLASLYYFWHLFCCRSPFCCWHCDVSIVSAAVGLPPYFCRLNCFCKHPCFLRHPYCVGGPVVATFLLLLAFLLLWAFMKLLNVACCWRYCCCLCHCCCLHPICGRHGYQIKASIYRNRIRLSDSEKTTGWPPLNHL